MIEKTKPARALHHAGRPQISEINSTGKVAASGLDFKTEIAAEIADEAEKRTRFGRIRLADLERVVRHDFPNGMPADIDSDVITALCDTMRFAGINLKGRVRRLRRLWRAPPDAIRAACEGTSYAYWRSADLGNLLGLSVELREALRTFTIRPEGFTDADMAARRKERDRERKRMKRLQAGMRPMAERQKDSVAARARAEGVSLRTIYNRAKKAQSQIVAHMCPQRIELGVRTQVCNSPKNGVIPMSYEQNLSRYLEVQTAEYKRAESIIAMATRWHQDYIDQCMSAVRRLPPEFWSRHALPEAIAAGLVTV